MKGIENWKDAKKEYKRGQMVRFMLGQAKWLDGLWNGDSIMVKSTSQALRGDVKGGDLVSYNGKTGFTRFRVYYRNITVTARSYLLVGLDDITSDEEE